MLPELTARRVDVIEKWPVSRLREKVRRRRSIGEGPLEKVHRRRSREEGLLEKLH